jgi:hypothetical protein
MVESAKPGVNFEAHLQEGELRTSRDVLDWLDEYDGAEQLGDVRRELRAQLRRERRQACRRGALREWRHAANYVRAARTHRDPDGVWWASGHTIYFAVRECLAFRAAARLK